MKRVRLFCAVGMCLLLAGCDKFSPEGSGISISKKGVVTEVSQEAFDKAYYGEAELENEIDSQVASYNAQFGEKSVRKKSLAVENGQATLCMTYATAQDYAAFNGIDFYIGDITGAVQAGYTFEKNFYSVADGRVQTEKPLFGSQVMTGKNYSTVATRQGTLVQVPGVIRIVSEHVNVTGEDTAVIEPNQEAYILYE